ncbi:MAG: peptidase [Frankiaceae bacterium]|nr:peptidase [Frankiaceae bacterium]
MHKALALLLVAGALAPATVAFAADGPGGVSISLAEAPTSRRADPRASIYIIDHVKPGTTITRKLLVTDKSTGPLNVALYSSAASIRDGEFFPAAGHEPNELSTWTTVSTPTISLQAGASQPITTTIAVPAKASAGERYGVVWAEIASSATTGVKQVNRVGIRIYLSVGPGGEPPSDFTVDTLQANRLPDGTPVVYALVHNTGGRALDMSGSMRLTNGPGGLSAGPFTAKLGTTLGIKDTEPVTVLLDKALPAGPWLARIDLQSGLTKRAATATLTFPDAGAAPAVTAAPVTLTQSASKNGLPLLPILGTAGGIGLVGLLALVVFKRPRRRGGSHAKHGH